MKNNRKFFLITALFALSPACVFAADAAQVQALCGKMQKAWDHVQGYECTYRAVTAHEGKSKESLMKYFFERTDKVRMDIQKPKAGAVLIYNPEVSHKVRVRPFAKMKFVALSFDLKDPKVSSDNGGTIPDSTLGSRMRSLCRDLEEMPPADVTILNDGRQIEFPVMDNKQKFSKKYFFNEEGLIIKVELWNDADQLSESFDWFNLKINPAFPPNLFIEF